jgi:hypothetical protein
MSNDTLTREKNVPTRIKAAFDVTNWEEHPFDEGLDTAKLTKATVTKDYSGDIEGSSVTEWLMAYANDGTATFVGLERVSGTVAGDAGTIVLQHVGTFEDGAAKADLTVVRGCGTGNLTGVTGQGEFLADPGGLVALDLD